MLNLQGCQQHDNLGVIGVILAKFSCVTSVTIDVKCDLRPAVQIQESHSLKHAYALGSH
jgi:hypothetical protein